MHLPGRAGPGGPNGHLHSVPPPRAALLPQRALACRHASPRLLGLCLGRWCRSWADTARLDAPSGPCRPADMPCRAARPEWPSIMSTRSLCLGPHTAARRKPASGCLASLLLEGPSASPTPPAVTPPPPLSSALPTRPPCSSRESSQLATGEHGGRGPRYAAHGAAKHARTSRAARRVLPLVRLAARTSLRQSATVLVRA